MCEFMSWTCRVRDHRPILIPLPVRGPLRNLMLSMKSLIPLRIPCPSPPPELLHTPVLLLLPLRHPLWDLMLTVADPHLENTFSIAPPLCELARQDSPPSFSSGGSDFDYLSCWFSPETTYPVTFITSPPYPNIMSST